MYNNTIHIEPSSRCTLLCPQCPRTEYLPEISIDDCDIESTVRACAEYSRIIMCGNHGDPIYHARFHELVEALKCDRHDRSIRMITNGAFRSANWWEKLASQLNHEDDTITFSIDGLPTSNHIYRVNSKWPSIEAGISSIKRVNPKLRLIWKWIVFRYNEDEILQGRELAKSLGFAGFMLVKSVRYENGNFLTPLRSHGQIKQEILACQQ